MSRLERRSPAWARQPLRWTHWPGGRKTNTRNVWSICYRKSTTSLPAWRAGEAGAGHTSGIHTSSPSLLLCRPAKVTLPHHEQHRAVPAWLGLGDASRADRVFYPWGAAEGSRGPQEKGKSQGDVLQQRHGLHLQPVLPARGGAGIQAGHPAAPHGWQNLLEKLSDSLKEFGKPQQLLAQDS